MLWLKLIRIKYWGGGVNSCPRRNLFCGVDRFVYDSQQSPVATKRSHCVDHVHNRAISIKSAKILARKKLVHYLALWTPCTLGRRQACVYEWGLGSPDGDAGRRHPLGSTVFLRMSFRPDDGFGHVRAFFVSFADWTKFSIFLF